MQNLKELHTREVCVYIKNNENSLSDQDKKNLIEDALNKVECSWDYTEIACVISHQDSINDKKWAKTIFQKAYDEAEESSDLEKIAFNVSAKSLLDDKQWGRQLFVEALQKTNEEDCGQFDSYCSIACNITDLEGQNDKQWARQIFELAQNKTSTSSDLIELAQMIADDLILGDKAWASRLIDKAASNIQYGSDYFEIAFCLGHQRKLNDQSESRKWFEKAVIEVGKCYPVDYFDIAKAVASDQILDDKDWAIELCLITVDHLDESDDLLDIACFVLSLDKDKSIGIFKVALEKAETAMKLSNVAYNIANADRLNDKKWGRQAFEKALSRADEDERKLITKHMNEVLGT